MSTSIGSVWAPVKWDGISISAGFGAGSFSLFFGEDAVALQNHHYGAARAPAFRSRPCSVKMLSPSKEGSLCIQSIAGTKVIDWCARKEEYNKEVF